MINEIKEDEMDKDYYSLSSAEKAIPSAWYFDKDHYQVEIEKIWRKSWLFMGSADSLSEPKSFKTVKIDNQSILFVKDKDSDIKAYYNTCRHRGSVLCQEEKGKLKTNLIVCPYHQWSYSTVDGSLKGTTSNIVPDDFDRKKYGLYPVRLEIWRGLMFINFDETAKWENEKVFQDFQPILTKYPLEQMKFAHSWRKVVNCNWKIYWENFSECLHCPNIHPELSDLVPIYGRRIVDPKDLPNWQQEINRDDPKYKGTLREGAETWSADGSTQGHTIEIMKNIENFSGQSYSTTWPTMFLGVYADHIRTVRMLPIGPEQTELVAEWYFTQEAIDDPNYKTENVTDFAQMVMLQDADASEMNQQGLYNSPFTKGVLMPEEYTIKAFYDWLYGELK